MVGGMESWEKEEGRGERGEGRGDRIMGSSEVEET